MFGYAGATFSAMWRSCREIHPVKSTPSQVRVEHARDRSMSLDNQGVDQSPRTGALYDTAFGSSRSRVR